MEQGNAGAQYYLSLCYENEWGVKRDDERAFELCLKSAEQDYVYAEYRLGQYYVQNKERELYGKKALYWFSQAAKSGYTPAVYKDGVCCAKAISAERDPDAAKSYYKQAAEKEYYPA